MTLASNKFGNLEEEENSLFAMDILALGWKIAVHGEDEYDIVRRSLYFFVVQKAYGSVWDVFFTNILTVARAKFNEVRRNTNVSGELLDDADRCFDT